MTEEKVYNQEINGDEGFIAGDGYPSCNGTPCANMADDELVDEPIADTVADEPTDQSEEQAPVEEQSTKEEPADDWRDKFLRLQAEFDNYRKRTLR